MSDDNLTEILYMLVKQVAVVHAIDNVVECKLSAYFNGCNGTNGHLDLIHANL